MQHSRCSIDSSCVDSLVSSSRRVANLCSNEDDMITSLMQFMDVILAQIKLKYAQQIDEKKVNQWKNIVMEQTAMLFGGQSCAKAASSITLTDNQSRHKFCRQFSARTRMLVQLTSDENIGQKAIVYKDVATDNLQSTEPSTTMCKSIGRYINNFSANRTEVEKSVKFNCEENELSCTFFDEYEKFIATCSTYNVSEVYNSLVAGLEEFYINHSFNDNVKGHIAEFISRIVLRDIDEITKFVDKNHNENEKIFELQLQILFALYLLKDPSGQSNIVCNDTLHHVMQLFRALQFASHMEIVKQFLEMHVLEIFAGVIPRCLVYIYEEIFLIDSILPSELLPYVHQIDAQSIALSPMKEFVAINEKSNVLRYDLSSKLTHSKVSTSDKSSLDDNKILLRNSRRSLMTFNGNEKTRLVEVSSIPRIKRITPGSKRSKRVKRPQDLDKKDYSCSSAPKFIRLSDTPPKCETRRNNCSPGFAVVAETPLVKKIRVLRSTSSVKRKQDASSQFDSSKTPTKFVCDTDHLLSPKLRSKRKIFTSNLKNNSEVGISSNICKRNLESKFTTTQIPQTFDGMVAVDNCARKSPFKMRDKINDDKFRNFLPVCKMKTRSRSSISPPLSPFSGFDVAEVPALNCDVVKRNVGMSRHCRRALSASPLKLQVSDNDDSIFSRRNSEFLSSTNTVSTKVSSNRNSAYACFLKINCVAQQSYLLPDPVIQRYRCHTYEILKEKCKKNDTVFNKFEEELFYSKNAQRRQIFENATTKRTKDIRGGSSGRSYRRRQRCNDNVSHVLNYLLNVENPDHSASVRYRDFAQQAVFKLPRIGRSQRAKRKIRNRLRRSRAQYNSCSKSNSALQFDTASPSTSSQDFNNVRFSDKSDSSTDEDDFGSKRADYAIESFNRNLDITASPLNVDVNLCSPVKDCASYLRQSGLAERNMTFTRSALALISPSRLKRLFNRKSAVKDCFFLGDLDMSRRNLFPALRKNGVCAHN